MVAGAGSGKTETLSLRILYLLDNARSLFGRDLSPDEILCLTFTRKAAAEIAERASARIASVFGQDPNRPDVTVATYNGYAAELAAEHGLRVAVDPGATILTNASLWQLADSVVQSWDRAMETDAAVSTVTVALARLAAQARDHRVTPADLRQWATDALDFIAGLPKKEGDGDAWAPSRRISHRSCGQASHARVDGRPRRGVRCAQEGGLVPRLLRPGRCRRAPVAHRVTSSKAKGRASPPCLLDEFQDTSPPQLDLFAQMFGADHPVMAVGDPNQAIYGFSGASADALRQFMFRFGGG